MAPLAILLVLGGGVLATARLAKKLKREREGFATHDDLIRESQQLYNPLTNLLDVLNNPFVGPNPTPEDVSNARADITGALGGINVKDPSVGANLSVRGIAPNPYTIPSDTSGMRSRNISKCEAVNTASCAAFDTPEFANNCGVCFKPGTNSQSANHIGGLFLEQSDKTGAQIQGRALNSKTVTYNPTVGTCPPGFFVVDKESCQKLEKKIDCQEKKTFGITNCSQCYADGSYTIVDPQVPRADLSLLVSFIGNLTITLTGTTTSIATASSTALGDKKIPIGQISEGGVIVITVDGPGATIGGFIEGPTVRGVFQLDIAQIADTDLESGVKPRFSGNLLVGGSSCIAMKPGRGKAKMSLRVNIPLTFVDVGEDEASRCPSGPFLTMEGSARTLSAGTCFAHGNAPGAYSMECLQEKFTELGCTSDGKGYPSDTASVSALNKTATGASRNIGSITDLIYENSIKSSTGVSTTGEKLTLPQWNDASMFCTGKTIVNPCDTVELTGSMSHECMEYLWDNKGFGNRIGRTYTGEIRSSSLTGQTDRFCTKSGLLSPFGPDGKPQTDAIQRAFKAGGTIKDIKELYDRTHIKANDNNTSDADRSSAISDCYGVSLTMPPITVQPPRPDELKELKQQYDSIMGDLNYLYGVGLGPNSGNVTFNDRYEKKLELDKKILTSIKARYVRIKPSLKPKPNDRCIQISQLQVFNSAGNEVARGKSTSSSSILAGSGGPAQPSKAVDGNPVARPYPQMFHDACDTTGQNQFWMVDLGSEQDLSHIVYYNRAGSDCCTHRADGMPVELLDSQMNIVGSTKIVGSAQKIRVQFTVFDKQTLSWNNLT